MAKKSIVTSEDTGAPEAPPLEQLLNESVFFQPTEEQRRVKIKFFSRIADNPTINLETVSLTQIKQITNSNAIEKWWPTPGMREWFLNKNEHAEALELLFAQSMHAMTSILLNEEPKVQGARVQLIKHLAEIAGKMPRKQATAGQYLDKAIAGMDEFALQAYLEKSGVQLTMGARKAIAQPITVVEDSTPNSLDKSVK